MTKKSKFTSMALAVAIMGTSIATPSYAAIDKYITGVDTEYHSYDSETLRLDIVEDLLNNEAPMYKRYKDEIGKNGEGLKYVHDDKKGYIDGDTLRAILVEKLLNGEKIDIDEITENEAETVEFNEKEIPVDEDGNLVYEDTDELKVESISAINSTVIEVKFNKPVGESAKNLDNYYIGMKDMDVHTSSIKFNNEDRYEATLSNDKKTVRIAAADSSNSVIWIDEHTKAIYEDAEPMVIFDKEKYEAAFGDDSTRDGSAENEVKVIEKNMDVVVQVRNVRSADGKLMNTAEASFRAIDKEAPKFSKEEVKIEKGTDKAVFEFNEPVVLNLKNGDNKFKVEAYLYVNGVKRNVTKEIESKDPMSVTLKDSAIKDLEVNKDGYKFVLVGVRDLAGNRPVADELTATLKITEPDEPGEETPPTDKFEFEEIKQVEEGKFEIKFEGEPADDTVIKVKDADGNTIKETTWKKYLGEGKIINFAELESDPGESLNVYKKGEKVVLTVEISGPNGGKIQPEDNKDGKVKAIDPVKKNYEFKLDRVAPSMDKEAKYDGMEIKLTLMDEPFGGVIKVDADKEIIIKRTLEDGQVKQIKVTTEDKNVKHEEKLVLTLNKDNVEALMTSEEIEELDGKEVSELPVGKYKVIVPKDTFRDPLGSNREEGSKKIYHEDNTHVNYSKELEAEFTVKKDEEKPEEPGVKESVPQTAQRLVKYDKDRNEISVLFLGDNIDIKTLKDASNYAIKKTEEMNLYDMADLEVELLENKDLFEKVKEYKEYHEGLGLRSDEELPLNGENGAEVRIKLHANTIEKDGHYTLVVKDIATKKGAKMLETEVTVYDMKDNYEPKLIGATVRGDQRIELKFDESVKLQDLDGFEFNPEDNFKVTLDGVEFRVEEVTEGEQDHILILKTKDNMNYEKHTVRVKTKLDRNDNYFVTDLGENQLKTGIELVAEVDIDKK